MIPSRRQLEPQFCRRNYRNIFLAERVAEHEPSAAAFEDDSLPVLPPGHVMPPLGIGQMPLTAVIEMDKTIPHETEIPALEYLSVHVNKFGRF